MQILTRYCIDIFSSRYISGWIFRSFRRTRPVCLRFVSGNREIGSIIACRDRRDLKEKNIHPTGLCGFDISFPANIDITVNKTLDIHLDDETRPWLRLSTNYLQRPTTTDIPPVLFMHIPKTAGTSFNSFMRTHLPFNVMACHIEKYASDSFAALSRSKKYLAGHLTIEKFKNHFPISGFDCYSIVRSPYNHLHSHLNWLKGIATHSDSQFFKQHNTAVQQLAVKVSKVDFNNLLQVKKFVFGLRGFELYFFDNCQTRYFLDYCPQKVSRNDFQNTLENIDLFKYVGLTEEYDQFKEFVASTYRLPRVSLPEKLNRMTGPRLYDPESKEIEEVLFPLVHTDMLLYGYISNHFSSSCRGSYLQQDKSQNQLANKYKENHGEDKDTYKMELRSNPVPVARLVRLCNSG